MQWRRAVCLMTAALLSGAATGALAGGAILTGKDIKQRVSAGAMSVRTGEGYEFPVSITLRADGSMEGISSNGYVDTGRWWTRGDALCHQWAGWFDGLRKCLAVAAEGNTLTLIRPDARHFDTATLRLRK